MQRILAIGGFSTGESETVAATYIRHLTGKQNPRICLLSTPAGDPQILIRNFEETYGHLGFETSNIVFFGGVGNSGVSPDEAAAHLLTQDAVFVSGGNPRCALALWNEWGVSAALRDAWHRGVLLSGMSAGAVCWFENHVPPPSIKPTLPLQRFLGFLEGACGVHYEVRREHVWKAMHSLELRSAMTIDDDAAILYEENKIAEVLSWRDGATAYRLERESAEIHEQPLLPTVIGSLRAAPVREPIFVEIESRRACVGRYELMNPMQVLITLEGDQLFAQYGAQPKLPIFPQSENKYFFSAVDAQVSFQRNRDGIVTSLMHYQHGREANGVRVSE
jgi:dipeptidase E